MDAEMTNNMRFLGGRLVRRCLLRLGQGPARRGRRTAFTSLSAAALVALGVGISAPAMASTAPSMTTDQNSVIISAEGPDHSLMFYYAHNGTSTWHPETVAGPGTTW